jgi:hypothetical protein
VRGANRNDRRVYFCEDESIKERPSQEFGSGSASGRASAAGIRASMRARPRPSKGCWRPTPIRSMRLRGLALVHGERSPELLYNTGLLLQKSGQLSDADQRATVGSGPRRKLLRQRELRDAGTRDFQSPTSSGLV